MIFGEKEVRRSKGSNPAQDLLSFKDRELMIVDVSGRVGKSLHKTM